LNVLHFWGIWKNQITQKCIKFNLSFCINHFVGILPFIKLAWHLPHVFNLWFTDNNAPELFNVLVTIGPCNIGIFSNYNGFGCDMWLGLFAKQNQTMVLRVTCIEYLGMRRSPLTNTTAYISKRLFHSKLTSNVIYTLNTYISN
jgi:hypothetical protein